MGFDGKMELDDAVCEEWPAAKERLVWYWWTTWEKMAMWRTWRTKTEHLNPRLGMNPLGVDVDVDTDEEEQTKEKMRGNWLYLDVVDGRYCETNY